MELNPIFLKTFKALVENKSFTRTAEILHMTQPGVSQHIKGLETLLGKTLIHRHGKSFTISEEGEKLYVFSLNLSHEYELFMESLDSHESTKGSLLMGSPGSFGITFYTFLLDLKDKYPGLTPLFHYTPNTTIENEVLSGNMILGIMTVLPSSSLLSHEKIGAERLCLVTPANFKVKNFKSLKELGFIGHPDGDAMGEKLLSANWPEEFEGMDKLPKSGSHNQIHRILEPVSRGHGFTILPEFACKSFSNQKSIKLIKLKICFKNDIFVVYRKHRPLPSRYQLVLEEWKNWSKKL